MQPEALMLYKLIILYILDRVDFPMSNAQLTDFITSREYTSYFNVQTVLGELVEDDYVSREQTRSQTLYRITKTGRETLSYFCNEISKDIRDDIDLYLTQEKYSLRDEVSTLADFYPRGNGEYITELKIMEKDDYIVELKLTLPNGNAAQNVCNNWKRKNADIYAYVLNSLLNNDEPEDTTHP